MSAKNIVQHKLEWPGLQQIGRSFAQHGQKSQPQRKRVGLEQLAYGEAFARLALQGRRRSGLCAV
jgi:hypothetical protein